jgi:hypothetical protein
MICVHRILKLSTFAVESVEMRQAKCPFMLKNVFDAMPTVIYVRRFYGLHVASRNVAAGDIPHTVRLLCRVWYVLQPWIVSCG